ncbi:MAG: hypothetical protein ACJ72R_11260 [Nitrososphaeraceae archaeon]|jgi:hypothetical protein
MRKIISLIWAFITGAVVIAVANSTALMNNATMSNATMDAAGNISRMGN